MLALDPDDTPDDVVIENIQQGFKEALSGQLTPLEQMWEGIEVTEPFEPRSFYGVTHESKDVIDDYLASLREGWQ